MPAKIAVLFVIFVVQVLISVVVVYLLLLILNDDNNDCICLLLWWCRLNSLMPKNIGQQRAPGKYNANSVRYKQKQQ